MAITPQDKRDIRLRVPLNEVPHIDLVTPVTDFQRVNELGEHDLVGALSPRLLTSFFCSLPTDFSCPISTALRPMSLRI